MDLRTGLQHFTARLDELETVARKLPNQNFADIIKAARGRLAQLHDHPDVDAVGALFDEPAPADFDPAKATSHAAQVGDASASHGAPEKASVFELPSSASHGPL